MKITCNDLGALHKALSFVTSFVGTSSINVVYRLLYIAAEENSVRFRAMNGAVYVDMSIPMDTQEEGEVLVDPKLFVAALGALDPNKPIQFRSTTKNLNITQGQIKRRVQIQPTDEFPSIPNHETMTELSFSLSELIGTLALVEFAASDTRERPILTGVHLDKTHGRLIATDSICLAGADLSRSVSLSSVIHRQLCDILRGLTRIVSTDEITLAYGDMGWFYVHTDVVDAWIARLEGEYPTVATEMLTKLITGSPATTLTFSTADLLPFLEVAMVYSDAAITLQESKSILLQTEGGTTRMLMDSTLGRMDDVLSFVEAGGRDAKIKLDPHYLAKVLQVSPASEMTINIWDSLSPVLITAKDLPWAVILTPMYLAEEIPTVEDDDDW